MTAFRTALVLAAGLAATAAGGAAFAGVSSVKTPYGVSTRMTGEGPVFTDARGMTLYKGDGGCSADRRTRLRPIDTEGDVDFDVAVERARSCLEKSPPLRAPSGAVAVGKWSVVVRPDGISQWAYDGQPVYTSSKDKRPGDVNGSYLMQLARGETKVLYAPVAGVPADVKLRQTVGGLTLADEKGRALYVRKRGECDAACARDWRPLTAPAIARPDRLVKGWSIVSDRSGERQWAYRGRPLYTHVHDASAHGEQVFGDVFGETWGSRQRDWDPAVVIRAEAAPPGVIAQTLSGETQLFSFGLSKVVYADGKGRPLYTMHCIDGGDEEENGGGVACDDVGDDPRYWLSSCGGPEACARTWRPLPAAADAKPRGHDWTVVVVNPAHPFAPVVGGRGQRVWAFKGRPVFTYAHDRIPGDFYGDDHGFGTTGAGQMQARPIPAQAYAQDIHLPQMQVARAASGGSR